MPPILLPYPSWDERDGDRSMMNLQPEAERARGAMPRIDRRTQFLQTGE